MGLIGTSCGYTRRWACHGKKCGLVSCLRTLLSVFLAIHSTIKEGIYPMIRNSRSLLTVLVGSGLALFLSAPAAFAQGTPWLAEPGTGTVNISFVNQNATEFYRQTTKAVSYTHLTLPTKRIV